jgi:ketosteroid isomerase-like protein
MDRANETDVERLLRSYEAFNRGDFDAVIELAHPEVEWGRAGDQPPLRGADAVRDWMEPDAFDSMRFEPGEIVEERNRILVRQRAWARGAGSGIEMQLDSIVVWTLDEEGLITRLEVFETREEEKAFCALRAL